jgi:hypothetical protein
MEILLSRYVNESWTSPINIADGIENNKRYPAWNPVLYYEIGKTIRSQWDSIPWHKINGDSPPKPVRAKEILPQH